MMAIIISQASPVVDPVDLVERWFSIHRESLVRYAHRRVGASHAEDIVSEVLIRALAGAPGLRVDELKPWLFGITFNVIAEHRRAERRQWRLLEKLVTIGDTVAEFEEAQGVHPQFVRALSQLPADQRETLLLVIWGELTYAECAVALSVPIGTVRSRVARAKRTLRSVSFSEKR